MTKDKGKYWESVEYYEVYSLLIQAAKFHGVVEYMEVALILGITQPGNHMSREVGQVLGEISKNETEHSRPMLSAVVVTTSKTPGEGFYAYAQDLERWDGKGDKELFWKKELRAVYKTWTNKR